MKYLKFKTIREIYEYNDLRLKYGISEEQALVEDLLDEHIKTGLLLIPERPNNVSKKVHKREVNLLKYNYLKSLPEVTEAMLRYFQMYYIDPCNTKHYNPLSHEYKHIIIHHYGQDWVRTIHSSKYNAVTIEGVKGILAEHNDEPIFLTKTAAFKCERTGNKKGKFKEVKTNEVLMYF